MTDQYPYQAYGGAGAYNGPAWPQAPAGRSMDPIISRLRPRDIVGILDQSFRIYRKNFLTFLAILAVVHVPLQTLIQVVNILVVGTSSSLTTGYDPYATPNYSTATQTISTELVLLGVEFGLLALYYVFIAISQAALVSGVADSYLDKPVSFGGAYRKVWQQKWQVLGLMLLQILIYVAAFAPVILLLGLMIGVAIGGSSSGAVGGIACLAFLLFFVGLAALAIVVVRLQAAVPALIVENLGPRQAIQRSWNLLKNYWWRTFGLFVLLYILNMIVASGPAALISGLAVMLFKGDLVMSQAISGAVTVLISAVFMPLQYIAITLYYFDTRVRREGFDIEAAVLQAYPNAYPQPNYPGAYRQQQYGQNVQQDGYGQQEQYGYGAPAQAGQVQPPTLGYGQEQQNPPAHGQYPQYQQYGQYQPYPQQYTPPANWQGGYDYNQNPRHTMPMSPGGDAPQAGHEEAPQAEDTGPDITRAEHEG